MEAIEKNGVLRMICRGQIAGFDAAWTVQYDLVINNSSNLQNEFFNE